MIVEVVVGCGGTFCRGVEDMKEWESCKKDEGAMMFFPLRKAEILIGWTVSIAGC